MKCPWLQGNENRRCAAVSGLVVVSTSELERFCQCEDYVSCPVYRQRKRDGGLISLSKYYSIYLSFVSSSETALNRQRLLNAH